MPLYEYACPSCGDRFDRLQGYSDPGPACPSCGSSQVNRLISLISGLTGSSSNGGSAGCGCGGACACGR
jgi:putative FmdB family regulatory protein